MRRVVIPLVGGLLTLAVALAAAGSAGARSAPAAAARGVAAASKTNLSLSDADTAGFRNVREACACRIGRASAWDVRLESRRAVLGPAPAQLPVLPERVDVGMSDRSGLRPWDPTCTLSDRQEWRLLHFSNGAVGLRNHYTARCLDYTRAGGLRSWPCNGTTAQQWFSSVT